MIDQSLCILGRQPAIGLAELESLYGADRVHPASSQAALVDVSSNELAFNRLGGTVKLCKLLTTLSTATWKEIEKHLLQVCPSYAEQIPEGKLQLGLSVYGLNVSVRQLEASGLTLKKAIRQTGRSVRLIPNKELQLSSAQVIHNHLTGSNGLEIVCVRRDNETIIGQTVAEQDIAAYTLRDRERPKRDARIGMLPPKLAQVIINMGVTNTNKFEVTILDPFCGTGVLLQEAALMGYNTYGSDLEPRMIAYSEANLEWLQTNFQLETFKPRLETADATACQWTPPFDVIASELYLGRPLSTVPSAQELVQIINDVNTITRKFLQNVAQQTPAGFRLSLAVPAWHTAAGFRRLPTLDHLEEIGYTRVSFEHASDEDLIYHREGQIVARELLVIIRK